MPYSPALSRWSPRKFDAVVLLGGAVLLSAVVLLSGAVPVNAGETLTRNTIRLSLAWYAVALCLMMQLEPEDWTAQTRLGQLARWCWTWALACFLVHLAMAFHYYHHWSHAHAFEHTRAASGLGEGIYFSYLFTLLWTADACWWWFWPAAYAERSAWYPRALHGLMLFMVFNGMVVYESGPIRWAGVAMFAGLIAVWLRSRAWPRLRPA